MIPIPHLGQASAHPNEAMNSIQPLHLTRRHMALLGVRSSPSAAGQVSYFVRRQEAELWGVAVSISR